jgi:hypothetical protein
MPLLPHLSDLVIEDADASIAYIDLLLSPSLKTLKAPCIPDAQQSTFSFFLTAIEQEVPLLQTLILGPGRFLPSSLQTISQFNSLRHLELKLEDSKLSFAFFDNIGSLAMLETFILDARYVSGTMTGDEPTVLPPFPSDNFPNSNAMDGNPEEHVNGAADVRHSKTCRTPICSFNQLAVLHVIGWLPLLKDLIHRVTSTKLEDVSVTFIRLSYDELKVSLAKEEAEKEEMEREMIDGERRREQEELLEMERKKVDEERRCREEAEKKMKEQEKLREDEMERERIDGVSSLPPSSLPPSFGHMSSCEPGDASCEPLAAPCEPMLPTAEIQSTSTKKGKKKKGMSMERRKAMERVDQEVMEKQEAMEKQEVEVRERLLKEQERLTSLSFEAHTVSFTEVLRKLYLPSLKSLHVCQLGRSFQCLLKPSTLPEEVFRTMLLLPAIESLEVKGWILDFVEGVFSAAEPIPNLKCLLLPLDEPNSSISLPTLRHVAKTCPKLESFQCYIDSLSPISIPTDVGLSHGLRTLSVGSSFPHPVAKRVGCLIARHLYLLFPKLETIKNSEEHNAELWVNVDELVKMCQTARMDDLNRQ